jgi:hypothetical protein
VFGVSASYLRDAVMAAGGVVELCAIDSLKPVLVRSSSAASFVGLVMPVRMDSLDVDSVPAMPAGALEVAASAPVTARRSSSTAAGKGSTAASAALSVELAAAVEALAAVEVERDALRAELAALRVEVEGLVLEKVELVGRLGALAALGNGHAVGVSS